MITLCTSHVAGEELDKLPPEHRRMHRLVYDFIRRLPKAVEAHTDSGVKGGTSPDQTFADLRRFLSEQDARHVFQAIKNEVNDFLTLDGGIRHNAAEIAKHRVRVLAPTELVQELNTGR